MRMRISFLANRRERSLVKVSPILVAPYDPPFHSQLPTSDEHKRTKTRTKKHKTRKKKTIYKRKRSRPGKQIWSSQDKRENKNHHSRELQTSPDFWAEVTDLNTIAIARSGFPTAKQSGNRKPISAHTKQEKATLQRMQTKSTREVMQNRKHRDRDSLTDTEGEKAVGVWGQGGSDRSIEGSARWLVLGISAVEIGIRRLENVPGPTVLETAHNNASKRQLRLMRE
jgi:ribosomal protein L34